MTSKVLEAARFARKAHEGQVRKYNGQPYITHPIRVAVRVSLLPGATDEMVMAAYLHDTIEDTSVSYDNIKDHFGAVVANYVLDLTNISKGRDASRSYRKQMDRERLKTCCKEVKQIKMVDRIDNLRELPAGDFRKIYVEESRLLAYAIGDGDDRLRLELLWECK